MQQVHAIELLNENRFSAASSVRIVGDVFEGLRPQSPGKFGICLGAFNTLLASTPGPATEQLHSYLATDCNSN
jgi:hypothetical protein